MFRPQSDRYLLTGQLQSFKCDLRCPGKSKTNTLAPLRYDAIDKIHRRGADKSRNELVHWPVVKVEWRAFLFNYPASHDHHLIGHCHRLDLVVGHIDGRRTEAIVKLPDFGAHVHPERRIQIGKRFVEQERLRVADDGPAHGNALALPTGELPRISVEKFAQPGHAGNFLHRLVDFGLGASPKPHGIGQILPNGHVRIEGIGLEHHRQVPLAWSLVIDRIPRDPHRAAGDFFQSGDGAQQGGLAASRRPDQSNELSLGDLQADVAERVIGAIIFLDVFQLDLIAHLRAPEVRPLTIWRCSNTNMMRTGVT